MANSKIRILLVDGNELSRILARVLLYGCPGVEIVAETDRCDKALPHAREVAPDVVILGEDLPEQDAARFRAAFLSEFKRARVVDLSDLDAAVLRGSRKGVCDVFSDAWSVRGS